MHLDKAHEDDRSETDRRKSNEPQVLATNHTHNNKNMNKITFLLIVEDSFRNVIT